MPIFKTFLAIALGSFLVFFSATLAAVQILDEDTVWNGLVELSEEVQVAPGVILTLRPGTRIVGNGQTLSVYGFLHAVGSAVQFIEINDLEISPRTDFELNLRFVQMVEGSLFDPTGNADSGSFVIRDSVFHKTRGWYIYYPVGYDNIFSGNVFDQIQGHSGRGMDIGTRGHDGPIFHLTIANNLFIGQGINNWVNYGQSGLNVVLNSFIEPSPYSVSLQKGYPDTFIDARNNYWGTTNEDEIAEAIFDRLDNLENASEIPFEPYLTAPDPDTPIPTIYSGLESLEGCSAGSGQQLFAKLLFTVMTTQNGEPAAPLHFCSGKVFYFREQI